LAERVFNRVYHPPTQDYVYWLADNYDPTGVEYPGSPPFNETIDPVVVSTPDFGNDSVGVEVLVQESAPEADLAPGSSPNAYQDYSNLATAELVINATFNPPFQTISPSGDTLVDIEYFT
jgi:hypothetical protein